HRQSEGEWTRIPVSPCRFSEAVGGGTRCPEVDSRILGMPDESSARPQAGRPILAQTPADDADGRHHSERFEAPPRLGRISPVQFLSAPDSGQLWLPGKCGPQILHAGCTL